MIPLTPEQREHKTKTLNQLQINLPLLEAKLVQETRPEVVTSIRNQIEDIRTHIDHLQRELAEDVAGEPVADELCKRVANALVKEKFYMAKKYINKLESIEPFYPRIDRLREEAETGRISRRTRSIAEGQSLPYGAMAFPANVVESAEDNSLPAPVINIDRTREEKADRFQFFQIHIILSCLVVLLIICAMAGVGGINLLQWLIEGG